MKNLEDKDNSIWLENVFSFENAIPKDNIEHEEISSDENLIDELYSALE